MRWIVKITCIWYWSWALGNCFQINVGLNYTNNFIERKMANTEGFDNSLSISIINFTNYNLTYYTNSGLGMDIFVHNNSLKPPRKLYPIIVKPGDFNSIGVKRTFTRVKFLIEKFAKFFEKNAEIFLNFAKFLV